MLFLEEMFYESKPYLYGCISLYALKNSNGQVMLYSGYMLAFCCAAVFFMRISYRIRANS